MIAIGTRVRRALDDPRPNVPLDEAFDRIEKIHADTLKMRGDAAAKDRPRRGGVDLATPPNRVKDE